VNATVVKVHTWPMRLRFLVVWNYCVQLRFHDIAKEVMIVVNLLLIHQIDHVKSINAPNKGQYEPFCTDLTVLK
jgi:hypothetical protein